MSTLREIAKLANVSIASVSRALNGDTTYKMTEDTRQRIFDAAEKLDYKYRPSSTKERRNKSDVKIGCILSVTKDKYNDPYFMSILSGVEARLSSKGYELTFLRTGGDLEDEKVLKSTFKNEITGLILMETMKSNTYNYIREKVPYIVGVDTKRNDIDNVAYDHYDVAASAVRHLIEKGHTDIGFIGGSGSDREIKNSMRYRGYLSAMHAAGYDIRPEWVMDCQWDETLCIDLVKDLYALPKQPTAIFVASDLMAMAALSSLYEIGIKVPQQMAVIGLSNIEMSKYSNPPLTTLEVPTKELGYAAVDLLLARIEGDTLLPKKVILPTTLIHRSST